jgi:DNA-binding response OmpR family regulator
MTLPSPASPRILIVSADEKTTTELRGMLRGWGYPVELATDGVDGGKVLTGQTPPGIALIDAALPSLGGINLVAEVRRRTRKSVAWTMLMSEQVDLDTVASASEAGVDDLLLKPVDALDLRVRLRVAERVQVLRSDLEEQTKAVRFHGAVESGVDAEPALSGDGQGAADANAADSAAARSRPLLECQLRVRLRDG